MKTLVWSLLAVAGMTVTINAAEPRRPWSKPIPVGTNSYVRSLAFTPNNQDLVVGSDNGVVKVFPDGCPDRLPASVLEANSYETGLAISGDGKRLLVAGCPGGVSLFDLGTGNKLKAFSLSMGRFGLSVDGAQFWANGKVYDLTGEIKALASPKTVREFANSEILYMNGDGFHEQTIVATPTSIQIRNGAGDKLVRELEPGLAKFVARFVSADARWLVLESLDRAQPGLQVWELPAGKPTATLPVDGACHGAMLSPDGTRLVTVTSIPNVPNVSQPLYSVRVWEVATGKLAATVARTPHCWPIAISPRGQLAYTADGHEIRFLDLGVLR